MSAMARKLSEGSILKFIGIVADSYKQDIAPHAHLLVRSVKEQYIAQRVIFLAGGWEDGDNIAASSVYDLYQRAVKAILPETP